MLPRLLACLLLATLIVLPAGCTPDHGQVPADDDAGRPVDHAPALEAFEAHLAAEFTRLGIDPERVAATAPAGEANAVFDLAGEVHTEDPPSITFTWTERMLGDYNQDGLVGVSDLTPLGIYYDRTIPHDDPADHGGIEHWPRGNPGGDGAENWRLARVDGNDDGLIYLTDITTIAQHWEERLTGYRLYYRTPSMGEFEMLPNADNPGLPYTIPRTAAAPGDSGGPYRYSLEYSPPAEEGVFLFSVSPYDAGTDTEGFASAVLALPEGEPPTAVLTAGPLAGNPPLEVNFDASGSFDTDGEIVEYEWDFYGSGFATTHTDVPFATNTYTGGGTWTASVRVQDDQYLSDTATVDIVVNQAPEAVLTVDPDYPVTEPTIAVFNATGSSDPDGEIISYDYDWEDDGVYDSIGAGPEPPFALLMTHPEERTVRVRVIDNNGLTDTATATVTYLYGEWQVQTLDSAFTDAGEGCSLALVDGVPAVAYYHMGSECLMFTRATDELGTAPWNTPQALTNLGHPNEGLYPSLAVINGNPAISYLSVTMNDVRYIRATNQAGSEWANPPVTVYPNWGTDTSMREVNGRPALVYQTAGNDIYYQRSVDSFGVDWSALPRDIDGSGDDHLDPCLADIDGTPGVTYMRTVGAGKNAVMYVHAADAAGAGPWNDPVVAYAHAFDSTGYLGSLASVYGHPAITFNRCPVTEWDGVPVFARSDSPVGATGTWSVAVPVDLSDTHSASVKTSMAVVNGLPHVVYYDTDTGALWHVWGTDALGGSWLDPVMIDDGVAVHNTGAFCSLANINGHPAVAYQDETAGWLKYAVLD